VLDLGCGAGYGAAILRQAGATTVLGVDVALDAVRFARSRYRRPGVHFVVADAAALPLADGRFERAVCFEVLEHVAAPDRLVAEAARVVRPNGSYVASTPNRRAQAADRPPNPFHVRELDRGEFHALVAEFSPDDVETFEQTICEGVLVRRESRLAEAFPSGTVGRLELSSEYGFGASNAGFEPDYLLAVCRRSSGWTRRWRRLGARRRGAAFAFQAAPLGLFDAARRALRELAADLDEKIAWARRLEADVADRDATISGLERDLGEKIAWARALDAEIERARSAVATLQATLDERLAWARALEAEVERLRGVVLDQRRELETPAAPRPPEVLP
jgi:SAM-dependent methyltransferase